ncbi:TetR/AcrR family transcriptional regulator C-terminal domain-containing protein [Streptomyces oryzae]|uniref:TetR/AcrR family transcriptional regulator C-terminal domain-containing protein n=1 Tax=Streptomyces oryzae TaxID=1434886 RepID=A0ABS3XK76_9ACTN|nr:TetR/AcrR family transcriptional regulator [Streptomyces oryzae]MBO8195800.1 TetR/AcrR family transcriptional regulator C-terminal domain-containing protein [Streptomyces oryzae]
MAKPEQKREQQSPSGLPAGVAVAWGLQARPGKGPARALDVRRIVAAAIGIADAEGLAALSMSRVATEIGVSTMALYRYVESKDDLLILMEDAAIGTPPPVPEPEAGWRAGLAHWARAYRAVLQRHLWIVRIPIGTPPLSPHNVEWMEQALALLRGTGLDAEEKLGVLITISGYVRSNVALLADIDEATRAGAGEWEDVERRYWQLLSDLTAAGDFPAIRELLASGELAGAEAADSDGTADFDFGLNVILDGVEVLIASR